MSTRPAFHLHRFTPRPSASVPLEWVQDLRAEDFRVAQMFHHADADLKVAVLSLLRMYYRTPASYPWSSSARDFVPTDTWWTPAADPRTARVDRDRQDAIHRTIDEVYAAGAR